MDTHTDRHTVMFLMTEAVRSVGSSAEGLVSCVVHQRSVLTDEESKLCFIYQAVCTLISDQCKALKT